jgi:hypothetical protein
MTMNEFETWMTFSQLYPFDDLHRYHRPAALVASRLAGGDLSACLDWLQPDRSELTDADMATMRALGFTRKGE